MADALTNVEKPIHGQAQKKEELSKIAPAPKKQTPTSGGTVDSSKSAVQDGGEALRSSTPSPAPPNDMQTTFYANAFFEIAQNNPKLVEANPQLSAIIQTYLNIMKGQQ